MRMIEFLRLPLGRVLQSRIVIRAASSAAGNPQSDADFNPYEVIHLQSPIKDLFCCSLCTPQDMSVCTFSGSWC